MLGAEYLTLSWRPLYETLVKLVPSKTKDKTVISDT